jgi:hypothetical protein
MKNLCEKEETLVLKMEALCEKELEKVNGGGWTGLIPWIYNQFKPSYTPAPINPNGIFGRVWAPSVTT